MRPLDEWGSFWIDKDTCDQTIGVQLFRRVLAMTCSICSGLAGLYLWKCLLVFLADPHSSCPTVFLPQNIQTPKSACADAHMNRSTHLHTRVHTQKDMLTVCCPFILDTNTYRRTPIIPVIHTDIHNMHMPTHPQSMCGYVYLSTVLLCTHTHRHTHTCFFHMYTHIHIC